MIRTFFYWLTMCSILFFGACKKEKDAMPFDKNAYPLNVGNSWQYKLTNLVTNKIDTLVLKIISKSIQNNTTVYKCFLERGGSIIDSSQFILSDSLLLYDGLNYRHSIFGSFALKLPFKKDEAWDGSSILDQTTVIDYTTGYRILDKGYDIYTLKRYFPLPNRDLKQTIRLSIGIGLVNQQFDFFDSSDVYKEQFDLISYELK